MNTGSCIGIDIGATNTSIVSVLSDGTNTRTLVLGEENDVAERGGVVPFASLFAISAENKLFFGNKVHRSRAQLEQTCQAVASFRSLLGSDSPISVNGKAITPVQLTAEYLRCIKRVVSKKFNIEIKEASFSFPAEFSASARRDLLDAAKKAEITPICLIDETFSTYVSVFGSLKGRRRVLVLDWGGEAFTASLFSEENGRVNRLASETANTGGKDVDRLIAEKLHAMITAGKPTAGGFAQMPAAARDKLLCDAELVKMLISEKNTDCPVTIKDYGEHGTKNVVFKRDSLDSIVNSLINESVLPTVNSLLNRLSVSRDSLGAVVISGGSARLMAFVDSMRELFGESRLVLDLEPGAAPARGAAFAGVMDGRFTLSDDVGIMMSDNTLLPLLKKGDDALSCASGTYSFSVTDDSRTANIVIADGSGKVLGRTDVPVKGFLDERLEISASSDETMAAAVTVHSSTAPDASKDTVCAVSLPLCFESEDLAE